MDQMNQGKNCGCAHHKVVPLVITIIGLAFLLQALNIMTASAVSIVWPILLIVAGLTKIKGGQCRRC